MHSSSRAPGASDIRNRAYSLGYIPCTWVPGPLEWLHEVLRRPEKGRVGAPLDLGIA